MTAINQTVGFPIKRLEVLSITEYRGAGLMGKGGHLDPISLYKKTYYTKKTYILIAGLGRPVVFGFFQLDNEVVSKAEEVLEELQRNLTQKMLPDLPEEHLASPEVKEVKEEEKVLQLVGERDSQGRPHGEVNRPKKSDF